MLYNARDTLGILQHHDAVAGTEKQAVADNYQLLMNTSIVEMNKIKQRIFKKLFKKKITLADCFTRDYY